MITLRMFHYIIDRFYIILYRLTPFVSSNPTKGGSRSKCSTEIQRRIYYTISRSKIIILYSFIRAGYKHYKRCRLSFIISDKSKKICLFSKIQISVSDCSVIYIHSWTLTYNPFANFR